MGAGQQGAEISVTHGQTGNDVAEYQRLPYCGFFVIDEEKRLVLLDGPTKGTPKLIPLQDVLALPCADRSMEKEVAGVKFIVPQELESVSVVLIRSTLDGGSHHIRRMPELRGHVPAFHFEFLNRIDVRLDRCASQLRFRNVGPVE